MDQEITELMIPTVFTRRLLMSYLIATCFEAQTEGLEILTTGPVYTNSRVHSGRKSSRSTSDNLLRHYAWSGGKSYSWSGSKPESIDGLMGKYIAYLQISSGMMTSQLIDASSQNSSIDSQRMDKDQIRFYQMPEEFKKDLPAVENLDSESRNWNHSIDSIPDPATSVVMVIGAGIVACTVNRSGFQNSTKHKVVYH